MKVEIIDVCGLVPSLQALRLPHNHPPRSSFNNISRDDINLLSRLILAGDEHGKVARGIYAYIKVTAPRYWFVEMDTYNIGCTCLSSTSTMHTIHKGVSEDMFDAPIEEAKQHSARLQILIDEYNKLTSYNNDKKLKFEEIKRNIPECFMNTRIYAINYQTLRRIYNQRWNHRLKEWHIFLDTIETLPYADYLITKEDINEL